MHGVRLISCLLPLIKEEMKRKKLEKVTMRLRRNYYRVARNRHQTRERVFVPVIFPIFSILFFFFVCQITSFNTGYLYRIYFRLFSQKINWNSQISLYSFLFSFIHIGKHFREKIVASIVISLFLISMMLLLFLASIHVSGNNKI